ncbi:MAG: polysaccharide biosynthesis/export family protein [Cyanobacteria bacterium J06626_23]
MKTDDSRFWQRLPQLSAISTAGLTAVLLCMSQPARAQLPPLPDEAATDETAMDETAIDETAVADGPTSDTPADSPVLTGATAETDVPALPQSFVNAQGYSEYVLGPSDQILLSVVGYPEFEGGYVVLPDGTVTLPLVGSIPVAGRSLDQIDAVINERLKYYLVDPVVDVGLATLRPVIVSVSGAVHRPGPVQLTSLTNTNSTSDRSVQQDFTDGLPTLSSALLAAGGVTRDADIRVVTVRRLLPGGQMQSITIDLWEAIQAEGVGANFVLRDGDTVFIPRLDGEELDRRLIASSSIAPETIGVRVVGEVKTPGEIRVSPDSSVSGAVAAAGGPTSDANLGNVVLVRMDESGEVTQQPMDLSNLIDNYQVQEGDVVLVAKRGYLSFFDTLGRVLNPLNLFGIFGN